MPNVAGNILTIDFQEENWKSILPEYYTVADGATPFYSAGTFLYNGKNSLRSGVIGHNSSSQTAVTFQLAEAGSVEIVYTVSSENNYDWLWVDVDGVNWIKKSGTVAWTVSSMNLAKGEHTVTLRYTKDGSNSTGSDGGAVGYLKITGVVPPFAKKYLVQVGETLYTVSDGALVELETQTVSAETFLQHGFDDVPAGALLLELTNPSVLYWQDSVEYPLPTLTAQVTGVPPIPQTIVTQVQDMSDPTIGGIEAVTITASEDVLFAVQFGEGDWKAYNGNNWETLSTPNAGMNKGTFENIGLEAWAAVAVAQQYRVRFTLTTENSWFEKLVVHYLNQEAV